MAGVVKGQHGGRRNIDPTVVGFRQFCRDVISNPKVKAKIEAAALRNPEFALRLAEHGYGRPPQALDVRLGNADVGGFRCTFDDGTPIGYGLPATALPLPAGIVE